MLHTSSKLATTQRAFRWFFEIKDHPKIKLESAQILHRNNLKELNLSEIFFDKFCWDYLDGTNQIIMNCRVQTKPVKMILLIDNLQNRLFIEADSAEQEDIVLKYVF